MSLIFMSDGRYVFAHYLGRRWHQDELWEEDKPVEAVRCSGQLSPGKPWVHSGHSCGSQFDTCHLPKHAGDQLHPFMATVLPNGIASFSRIMRPAILQNVFWNGLRNMMNSSSCCTGFQIPDLNPIEHLWDVLEHGGSTSQLRLLGSATNVLVAVTTGQSMPWRVRADWTAQGGQTVY